MRHFSEGLLDQLVAAGALHLGLGREDEAVREHRDGERFHIVWQHEGPARDERARTRRGDESERRAR